MLVYLIENWSQHQILQELVFIPVCHNIFHYLQNMKQCLIENSISNLRDIALENNRGHIIQTYASLTKFVNN